MIGGNDFNDEGHIVPLFEGGGLEGERLRTAAECFFFEGTVEDASERLLLKFRVPMAEFNNL
jgi:hypothetical protein